MKICLLNVLHTPLDKRVHQKVSRSLLAAGHELVSICPRDPELPASMSENSLSHESVRFVFIPPASRLPARLKSVARLIRLGWAEHADLYIAPEPESWAAALAIKALTGGKVVFDMHEHVPSEFAKFFPKPMRRFMEWITIRFMRLFARYTNLIILTRESFDLFWRGLSTPRVTVINTNHLQPACTHIPKTLQQAFSTRPTIIHQGIFGDVRGSYQLLDAVKRVIAEIPDLQCIVLGRYVYGDPHAYRMAIHEAGLDNVFALRDAVPFEQVPAYIAVSQVGLILFQPGPLNHTLAMPHKLFDYMREARPVIAPDFSVEVARIVRETECGLLVDVSSPAAIADAIITLLTHPQEAARLGANGRCAVETKYNWQQEEQRLIAAIHSLP